MPESANPYQSPENIESTDSPDSDLIAALTRYRRRQRRWSIVCWAIGMLMMVTGLLISEYGGQFMAQWIQQTHALSLLLYLAGLMTILLGPISWFWFNKRANVDDGAA